MSTTVYPSAITYELLLTARQGISHHDAAIQDDSNRLLFERQKIILSMGTEATVVPQHTVDEITEAHLVPVDLVDLFRDRTFPEFIAMAVTRMFLDIYNREGGVGLFTDLDRYERLEARLKQAAIASPTLLRWWDRLTTTMQVGVHGGAEDRALLTLLTLPAGVQQRVLRVLAESSRTTIALAREWHASNKLASADYAAKVGKPQITERVRMRWESDALSAPPLPAQVVEAPNVTGNSLRHQIVREPAWWHLCQRLGLLPDTPGHGPLPAGQEALFVNGGNIDAGATVPDVDWERLPAKVLSVFYNGSSIEKGAKQPSNTHALALAARQLYPTLDLLGGVTDSFDLGESRLRVGGWLVCREYRGALVGSPAYNLPNASISVYDMLDDVTLTHQAGRVGVGQMIYSFETLCPGTQIVVRLTLPPFTEMMTRGALLAAVETYLNNDGTVGGQAARGFGLCDGDWLRRPDDADDRECMQAYDAYLRDNRDVLRTGLIDGTLGAGSRMLS